MVISARRFRGPTSGHGSRKDDVEGQPSSTQPGSFDAFYREYAPRVAGYVRRHVHDHELVDDLVQETLFRAYRHGLHTEAGDDQWRWLSTVARNLCIDQRALHRNWRERSLDDTTTLDLTAADEDDPEVLAVAADAWERVSQALERLSERERRLLVEKHLEGRRLREIAEVEDLHIEALKSALRRARRAFRESYAAMTDGGGMASVLGPIAAVVGLRVRELRARLSTMIDQATHVCTQAGASVGLAGMVTTAVMAGALGLGHAGSLGSPDGVVTEPTLPPTAEGVGAGSLGLADIASTRDARPALIGHASAAASPVQDGAWPGQGTATPRAAGPRADQGSEGAPGHPDRGTLVDPPTDAPGTGPEEPADVGDDSVDEPEDADIWQILYAPGPSNASQAGSSPDGSESASATASEEPAAAGDGDPGTEPRDPPAEPDGGDGVGGGTVGQPEVFALGAPIAGSSKDCSVWTPTGWRPQCSVLFHSRDGGHTWQKLPAQGLEASGIMLAPSYPDDPRIFGIGRLGLMVSTDGGRTFSRVPHSPPGFIARLWPGFEPGEEDRVVIGGSLTVRGGGAWVYHVDTGATEVVPIGSVAVTGIAFVPGPDGERRLLLAGLDPSRDHRAFVFECRASECKRTFGFEGGGAVRLTGVDGPHRGSLLAQQGQTLYRSDDLGQSFSPTGQHSAADLFARMDGAVYVVDHGVDGVVTRRSIDGGINWEVVGKTGEFIRALAVLPGGEMIAASGLQKPGLMRSADGGSAWERPHSRS